MLPTAMRGGDGRAKRGSIVAEYGWLTDGRRDADHPRARHQCVPRSVVQSYAKKGSPSHGRYNWKLGLTYGILASSQWSAWDRRAFARSSV